MTDKDRRPGDAANLRQQAEEVAREEAAPSPQGLEPLSPEETRRTLHELRVHQIELEVQNEELRRAQAELDAARARYFDLYDLAPVGYCTVSEEGLILEANLTAATLLGVARGALGKRPLNRFILKEDEDIYYLRRKELFETAAPQACELRMVKTDGTQFWARLESTAARDEGGAPVLRVVLSDITDRKRAEATLQEKVEELRQALDQIKTLSGILPICMHCKKIRDDKGSWNRMEIYIRDRTEAEFSHGICPECMKKLYPEVRGTRRQSEGGGPEP